MWSIDGLARLILDFCMARRGMEQADGREMMVICAYHDPMQVEDYVMLN